MSHIKSSLRASPSENFGCNNNKTLRQPTSQPARTTRLLVSTAAGLLVIASAGFGMLFAWQVGSKHDAVLGTLSVAMALGLELSKPFAISSAFASLRQWRIITAAALTLVGALAVGYSLQAELTLMSMIRGDLVAERASVRDAAQRADARYAKALAEIDALKPSGITKSATAAYLERRDELQTELQRAEADRQQAPSVAAPDPAATALAAYAGSLGVKTDPATLGLWMPLVGVLALELGAAFSVVLVRSVAGDRVAHVAQAHSTGNTAAQPTAPAVEDRKDVGPPAKRAIKPKKRRD
jgi:hypothetical protein